MVLLRRNHIGADCQIHAGTNGTDSFIADEGTIEEPFSCAQSCSHERTKRLPDC